MFDIRRETELTLKEAAKRFRGRNRKTLCYETVRQWTTEGRRGVVLESWMQGGTVVTSVEAIERFNDAITAKRMRLTGNLNRSTPTAAAIAAQERMRLRSRHA